MTMAVTPPTFATQRRRLTFRGHSKEGQVNTRLAYEWPISLSLSLSLYPSSLSPSPQLSCLPLSLPPSHPTSLHGESNEIYKLQLFSPIKSLRVYIKVRLNTCPSYQQQQKFGRGPVVHKTRVLRGTSNPQGREDFMVGMNLNPAFCCYVATSTSSLPPTNLPSVEEIWVFNTEYWEAITILLQI